MDNTTKNVANLQKTNKVSEPSMALSIIGLIFCAASLAIYYFTGYIITAGLCPAIVGITLGALAQKNDGSEKINNAGMAICVISAVITGSILYGAMFYSVGRILYQAMQTIE